ncbi:LPXTG cell wall anchor domain-containing protein [Olsenella sp. KGMB02461]|nr:LPXTG cell wall anchor domain-containing protein [Olsenella sp. KGMB02461]
MNNTSKNMLLKRILAFALSFVMVVTSTPVAPLAYAEQDLNIDAAPVVISDDDLVQLDAENLTSDPAAQDPADTDPAAPAAEQDAPSQEGAAPEEELALDQAPVAAATAAAMATGPARVAPSGLQNNAADQTVTSNGTKDLTYNDGKAHTLTVNPGVTLTTQIVVKKGTLTIDLQGSIQSHDTNAKDTVISDQNYNGTAIVVEGQGSVIIKGAGTLTGNGHGSVIIVQPRGKLTIGDAASGPTITGGSGSALAHKGYNGTVYAPGSSTGKYKNYTNCGGAVLVRADANKKNGGSFTLNNGIVQGNTVESAGGGIFIDQACTFVMNGGQVTGNTAKQCEGGGIYTAAANSTINSGSITGNKTETDWSWGGGGIFIENNGVLTMKSVVITGNTANGLGGGIAGCPHARLGLSLEDGVALYGNSASKTAKPEHNGLYNNSVDGKQVGDILAYSTFKDGFKADLAKDFYGTRSSVVKGTSLGGNNQIVMKGYRAGFRPGATKATGEEISLKAGDTYSVNNESVGFTSTYSGSVTGAVTISGNSSTTHGGGIGCNGTLKINYEPRIEYGAFNIKLQKSYKTSLGDPLSQPAGTFTFELLDKDPRTHADAKVLTTATNDSSGNIQFTLTQGQYKDKNKNDKKDQTWIFYVREVEGTNSSISYDSNIYTIDVHIKEFKTEEPSNWDKAGTKTPIVDWIKVNGKSPADAPLTNTFNVKGEAQLGVTKTASGLSAGTYSFELQEMQGKSIADKDKKSDGVADSLTVSVGDSVSQNQTANQLFKKMTYTAEGDHWYRIREKAEGDASVTAFDSSVYLVKVNVKKNGKKALKAEVVETYKAADANSELKKVSNTQSPAFINTNYLYEGFDFSIAKMLENDLENQFRPENGEFAFELFDNPDCSGEPLATAKNNASGKVEFKVDNQDYLKAKLKGMKPGALIYTTLYFREVQGNVPGVTYDKGIHSISLELKVTQGAKSDMGITKPVIGATAKVTMVDGKEVPAAGFTFINKIKVADAQVPFSATKRYNGNTTDKSGAFKFTFEALDSQKAAEGVYEARKGDALVADSAGKLVDNGTGVIKIEAANGDFAGSLAPVSFGDITYTKESYDSCKTYWYKVTENFLDNSSAISYDPTVYVAKVELTAANREIVPTVTYYRMTSSVDGKLDIAEIANTDDPMVFHNTDDAYLSMSFNIKKLFKNSLNNDLKIEDEKFTFQLTDAQGDLVSESTANAEGLVTFEIPGKNYIDKSLGDARDYEFTVTEVDPNNDKISFDQKTHKVVLTVKTEAERVVNSENAANNDKTFYKPVITNQTWDGNEWTSEDVPTVTNTIDVSTSFVPKANKHLSDSATADNSLFKFELRGLDGVWFNADSVAFDKLVVGEHLRSPETYIPTEDGKIVDNGVGELVLNASNAQFDENDMADVVFPEITYEQPGTYWYALRETTSDTDTIASDTSVAVIRVDVKLAADGKSMSAQVGAVYSAKSMSEPGLTTVVDDGGELPTPTFYNTGFTYTGFEFNITKAFQNTEGAPLPMEKFEFELWDGVPGETGSRNLGTFSNEQYEGVTPHLSDQVIFSVDDQALLKSYLKDKVGAPQTYDNLYIREVASADKDMLTDGEAHQVIVTLTPAIERPSMANASLTTTTYSCQDVSVTIPSLTNNTVTNRWQLRGSWTPQASKIYFGETAGSFDFTVQSLRNLTDAELSTAKVADLLRNQGEASSEDTGENAVKVTGSVSVNDRGEEAVEFGTPVTYTKSGAYWYALSEDGGTDPTVYVIRVEVGQTSDGRGLEVKGTQIYYADSFETEGIYEYGTEAPQFVNTSGALKFASYRAFAASDQAVDQKCLVDPKMWKVLEGRTLQEGEYTFDLIQVKDYTDTTGTVISTAKNDRYGMVDFDAANPVAGTEDDPCCLEFTAPGTYRYRVVENPDANRDPSVIYSDQIITFTVVVKREGGSLKATDMYYGEYKDGTNVRFAESADPDWHPTMTNKARGMSLKVRKTSVLDRDNGLEGATYSLFMVNNGVQDDIKVATGTSNKDGWIQFDDVNLQAGQLYYFKEFAAPAGHTVSEFRSPYFYLIPDTASPNGYSMAYSDTKDVEPGIMVTAEGDESDTDAAAEAGQDNALYTKPEVDGDGNALYTYAKDGGVYDEATTITFNKQETNTHNWVEGAKLQVVEKATGKVVEEWTTKASGEVLTAKLNVDTPYILHEVSAPDGYAVAKDVEFTIDSYGKLSVTSGTEDGNASLNDTTVVLFDRRLDVEEINRITRTDEDNDRTTRIAKTGDTTNIAPIILGLVAAVFVGVTVLLVVKRKRNQE